MNSTTHFKLLTFNVAGIQHGFWAKQMDKLFELGSKATVHFFLETENEYDPNAIRLETGQGEKLGYVPMAGTNQVLFRRLMNGGYELKGKINHQSTAYQVLVDVYMKRGNT